MDFVLGSITTSIILYLSMRYFQSLYRVLDQGPRYSFSQSSVHEMVKNILPEEIFIPKKKKTQSSVYEDKTNVRVIILEDVAYWIKDNQFYEAEIGPSGIDKESARVVDIMGLDKVQLDKMLFIIDKLREGLPDDSGSTGNK